MSDHDRLELQRRLAKRLWTLHQRGCAVCRRAQRSHGGLCATGRLRLYALESSTELLGVVLVPSEPPPAA